ncbi:MAG: hypothetical protein HBSAPP03_19430 [Phycisphaerae bacterium]|nr:MAG: hypothetical protein HBSAPP03_19430 [Phycisphaerae bacterium]
MRTQVRAILTALVLAVLVWVYAEAESLRSQDVSLELVIEGSSEPPRAVEVGDGAGGWLFPGSAVRLTVSIEGSTGAVDALTRRGQGRVVHVAPGSGGVPTAPGAYTLDLRDVLRLQHDFKDSGLTIRKVEPASVSITVDEVGSRDVRVSVVTPMGDLDGQPEATPRVVRVVGPAKELAGLRETSTATARVDEATWARLVPGRREIIPAVRLELPDEMSASRRARLEPPTADVVLTVRSRTASVILPSVPVHLRIAPGELAKFNIDINEQDRTLIDVTVSGPADLIRQVEDRTLPIIAFVPLSFEELERGIPSKDAVFTGLPGGALRFEVANRAVRLTITRRNGAGGGGAPPKPGS